MKPEPKVFTKGRPCTKFDIFTCFYGRNGFYIVQVDVAHSMIGVNVPRGMEREGRLERFEHRGAECYRLTEEGSEWLLKGFRNYLDNHPSAWRLVKYIPEDWKRPPARTRRVRPAI